jgi:hypothetical protein
MSFIGGEDTMFFGNLNVFIACLVVAGMTVGGTVGLAASLVLRPLLGERVSGGFLFPLAYLLLALVLAVAWWRIGLSPRSIKIGRERRFRTGHWVLALTNVLALAAIAGPIVAAQLTGNAGLAMLAWMALPVYALGFISWPAGLFMVWSAAA